MTSDPRVFELRTYYAEPGKLDALHARFRDHTLGLFERHAITVIGFWVAYDDEHRPTETLVYLLAFDSKDAADAAWASFRKDPDWIEARGASEVDGPLVARIESVFVAPTDYSPIA
jgi:hypothetical protein